MDEILLLSLRSLLLPDALSPHKRLDHNFEEVPERVERSFITSTKKPIAVMVGMKKVQTNSQKRKEKDVNGPDRWRRAKFTRRYGRKSFGVSDRIEQEQCSCGANRRSFRYLKSQKNAEGIFRWFLVWALRCEMSPYFSRNACRTKPRMGCQMMTFNCWPFSGIFFCAPKNGAQKVAHEAHLIKSRLPPFFVLLEEPEMTDDVI